MQGCPKKCPQWSAERGTTKSRDIPIKINGDLLSDVIKSATEIGRKGGNRHFAIHISPLRINR